MKPSTKTALIVIISILALIALFYLAIILLSQPEANQSAIQDNTVTRIIDGDTFQLASGDIVRLICVDAPELGKEGAEEATNFLSSLILGREVRLENDTDDKDSYGRLLRCAYLDELFINKELVSKGYAEVFRYGNNTARCDEIEE